MLKKTRFVVLINSFLWVNHVVITRQIHYARHLKNLNNILGAFIVKYRKINRNRSWQFLFLITQPLFSNGIKCNTNIQITHASETWI